MEKQERAKLNVFTGILLGILLLYVATLIVPLFWGFITSVKTRSDYVGNTMGLPREFEFKNYLVAINNLYVEINSSKGLETIYIERLLFNSLLYAVGSAFCITISPCIVSYCAAKFPEFRISKVFVTFVIVTMALPIVGTQPSELKMLRMIGLYDTMIGAYLLKSYFVGTYFLVFYATFLGIPKDFSEAAEIDGAGEFRIFFTLILPLVKNTFFTIMLIQFIGFWNDYSLPLLYLPSWPTLAYGLFVYAHSYRREISSEPMKMAGCMVLFIPIFIVFIIFQKQLMGNISMGGLKE